MRIAFSTGRPAHVVLPANLLIQRGMDVTIFTAAYRSRFRNLAPSVHLRWIPQFVPSIHFLTGVQLPRPWQRIDTTVYDHLVATQMKSRNDRFDIFWGWASGSLSSGRAARRNGARYILDRACPHVDTQQAMVREECNRLGLRYKAEPTWFRQRQLAEYEEADMILVPSRYSLASFPPGLQIKTFVAPLFGRLSVEQATFASKTAPFAGPETSVQSSRPLTFGTVGGQPLRKGFLYLLQAWERLHSPNARLLLRTDAPLGRSPVLRDLLGRLPNVQVVKYVEDMSDFYRRCDAFVFPTIDDGFGMVLLEAMAHGLPAITTTHCGAAELFTADRDLVVVPAQNSDALAEAIDSLYRSSERRVSLGTNARAAVRRYEEMGSYSLYAESLDRCLASLK